MAYAFAERGYVDNDFDSAEEFIEAIGGVDAFIEALLMSDSIQVYNFDDEVLKEYFRLKNERVEEVNGVYICESIDNLDLVVEEVLKLDKTIRIFNYQYPGILDDGIRTEPVYPTLTPEQQQRLDEKFPDLEV